jgi:hypothetical protein
MWPAQPSAPFVSSHLGRQPFVINSDPSFVLIMLVGWIRTLELLTPIAKTIPLLGSPLEGSLEAAVEILKFAQVLHLLH